MKLANLRQQGVRRRIDRPLDLDEAQSDARHEWDEVYGEWTKSWGGGGPSAGSQ